MFEVDVKNVTEEEEEGREGKGRTRLGFLLGLHLIQASLCTINVKLHLPKVLL